MLIKIIIDKNKKFVQSYKCAIEIDSVRNIDHKINSQKAIEQEFGGDFIRINPDKENFDYLKLSIKYLDTSNNCVINWLKNQLKNSW